MRKPQSAGHITPQEQRAARRYAAGSLRLRCSRYGETPRPSPPASTTVRAHPRAHHATSPPQRPPRRAATPLALKHTLQQCAPPPPRGASIRRLRVSCSLCLPHTSFTRGNRVKRSGPKTCRYGEAPFILCMRSTSSTLVFMFESVYFAGLGAKCQANWEKPQISHFSHF